MTDQTKKNLKAAFAGESQANRRYLAFAQKASEEGYPHISRLFRVIAESETIHATNHLKALGEIRSTQQNVQNALTGEVDETTTMYPMFMDQAQRDANSDALNSFYWANEAEKTHAEFYERALDALKQGKDLQLKDLYICSLCGYTIEGSPPEECPTCGKGKNEFRQVK
jgi:rubrerythrin